MPQKSIAQQIVESDAMLRARDEAMQTPEEVRRAFLIRPHQCGPVRIEPFSLGILMLFEEIRHPFHTGGEPLLAPDGRPVLAENGKPAIKPTSMRDMARGIFVFHGAEAAAEALAAGLKAFDAAALALVHTIAPPLLQEINGEISKTFAEGISTIPGGGNSNAERDSLMGPKANTGNGWTLTLLEALLAEYKWPSYLFRGRRRSPEDWVIFHLPLAKAFALYSAMSARYGCEPTGPTYVMQAMIRAKHEAGEQFQSQRDSAPPAASRAPSATAPRADRGDPAVSV